jgi:hypothetical protein
MTRKDVKGVIESLAEIGYKELKKAGPSSSPDSPNSLSSRNPPQRRGKASIPSQRSDIQSKPLGRSSGYPRQGCQGRTALRPYCSGDRLRLPLSSSGRSRSRVITRSIVASQSAANLGSRCRQSSSVLRDTSAAVAADARFQRFKRLACSLLPCQYRMPAASICSVDLPKSSRASRDRERPPSYPPLRIFIRCIGH